MTKLLFVDNGIEFDSLTFRQKPLGGAEVAFVSLVEALAKIGYEVVVYNNCVHKGIKNNVSWKKLNSDIEKENFDVLVVNRGDKFLNFRKSCKKRIFWIHNPASYLLKFRYLSKLFLNKFKIIFSSEFHKKTYPNWAPAQEKIIIPYGVEKKNIIKVNKTPKLNVIFTSNPTRELIWVLNIWKNRIHPQIQKAKLNIYGGTNTYGNFGLKHSQNMNNILNYAKSLKNFGIRVRAPLSREILYNKIKNSRLLIYRGTNDETFCMSVAEAQCLGIPCVVGDFGSLKERVINNSTGFVCKDENEFANKTIKLLQDDSTWMKMHQNLVIKDNHFCWIEIAKKWKKIID